MQEEAPQSFIAARRMADLVVVQRHQAVDRLHGYVRLHPQHGGLQLLTVFSHQFLQPPGPHERRGQLAAFLYGERLQPACQPLPLRVGQGKAPEGLLPLVHHSSPPHFLHSYMLVLDTELLSVPALELAIAGLDETLRLHQGFSAVVQV